MTTETRRMFANNLARRRVFQRLSRRIATLSGAYSLRERGVLEDELNEILADLDRCDGPKVTARITTEQPKTMMVQFYDGEGYPVNIDAARGELQRLN